MGILSFGGKSRQKYVPRRYLKVKNRNNIPIHAPIYIKFGKKARYMVRNMPIKFKVKILKISLVIKYLRFGRFGHVTSKIRKFAPLGSRDQNFSKIFFPKFPQKYFSNTAQVWGAPQKSFLSY